MVLPIINKRFLALTALLVAMIWLSACYYDKEDELYPASGGCDTTNVTYAATMAPLMQTHCNSCHSAGAASGNIVTATYEGLKSIAINGKLYGSISHSPGFSAMPKGGNKLPDCDLKKINAWINAGSPNN
jgi:hypothetical protein